LTGKGGDDMFSPISILKGVSGEEMTILGLYNLTLVVVVLLRLALLVRGEPVGRESLVRVSSAL